MAVKTYKPTTPGRRGMSVADFSVLSKKKPEKSLLAGKKRCSGRDNKGKISVRHRGGGHKRKYRMIDFKMTDKAGIPSKVFSIEYDPNRTAYIALLIYADGEKRYIIAPEGLKEGDSILTAAEGKIKIKTGNRMTLEFIPEGFNIHNIELTAKKGGQIIRSAGSSAKLMGVEGDYAQIEMPSGEIRLVRKECYASIGVVSNGDHSNIKIGKAGRTRWLGRRPQVTGKSMNPCDHPHGGGEGHTSIGPKTPKTPWGMPALGFKTRRRKSTNRLIIRDRRKKKR